MAKRQMQCQTCKEWVTTTENQVNVPDHNVGRPPLSARCAGSRRPPYRTKGFTNPPPSMGA